ncbi:hypothetical protein L873DRAFT_1803676 [Choiromyces venosus 120613-1]|uniref:Pre-mRNA-splicing factor 38B n=1 Tax=Choiromyces venosus 120613-1 TaxID=1336337 RepID=A0A3N4JZA2_9PEZI|nr:hypothetical protein L873DRAFT_1803676 [Choiromyces venosus 120613-1]
MTKYTDDFVAHLLKKEAAEQSSRLSRASTGPNPNAPKPNTRFLRNIVREVDSHNAALLAREKEKVRERERERSRERGRRDRKERERRDRRERERERSRSRLQRRHRHHGRSRHGSGSRTRRYRSRSKSPSRSRSRSRSRRHRHHRHHHHHHHRPKEEEPKQEEEDQEKEIGPPPPPRPRGRGATTSTNRNPMDAHFSPTYHPSLPPPPSPSSTSPTASGSGNWDSALEAYRDRQKWKTIGAQRLRDAGFREEEIRGWENGGAEKEGDVEGIRWAVKGGVREWDRGKVLDRDGEVL